MHRLCSEETSEARKQPYPQNQSATTGFSTNALLCLFLLSGLSRQMRRLAIEDLWVKTAVGKPSVSTIAMRWLHCLNQYELVPLSDPAYFNMRLDSVRSGLPSNQMHFIILLYLTHNMYSNLFT